MPYSPNLNPIEKFWANMKKWIKNKIHLFDNFYRAIEAFFALPNSS
ncbi:IS630 family transposase domain protein [Rickettsiales endosymbiont of Paramecium tredecaurelia]|nr:transposase [Candidatus Sarmatiella mevalonica]MBL3285021.1 IS630 family transposase domain protein [Candidatus Sarmatiella mevalonica]